MNEEKEIKLSIYKPTIFIIIGVTFNIIFASIFSILLVTVVLTIPTIVFNALLLIPRVNTKRYWAAWKIIPIVLSFLLTFIVFAGIIVSANYMIDLINDFIQMIDKFILFWNDYWPNDWSIASDSIKAAEIILNWSFFSVAIVGNALILFGWYKERPIGTIGEVEK